MVPKCDRLTILEICKSCESWFRQNPRKQSGLKTPISSVGATSWSRPFSTPSRPCTALVGATSWSRPYTALVGATSWSRPFSTPISSVGGTLLWEGFSTPISSVGATSWSRPSLNTYAIRAITQWHSPRRSFKFICHQIVTTCGSCSIFKLCSAAHAATAPPPPPRNCLPMSSTFFNTSASGCSLSL